MLGSSGEQPIHLPFDHWFHLSWPMNNNDVWRSVPSGCKRSLVSSEENKRRFDSLFGSSKVRISNQHQHT